MPAAVRRACGAKRSGAEKNGVEKGGATQRGATTGRTAGWGGLRAAVVTLAGVTGCSSNPRARPGPPGPAP